MAGLDHIGRYEVKEQIGQGGMARVYLAYDPSFRREVALKIMSAGMVDSEAFRERFDREGRTIAALEHRAIVPVYDFGEENGRPYLVMRLMTGGTLADRLARGPLPPANIRLVLDRIGAALDKAHREGIIHRDLKPANILFDADNQPYLSDFGIVKGAETTNLTATGGIIGTPAYMSPEQVMGQRDIDGRSDIYALGTVLFEMLTGKQPYESETGMGLAMSHVTKPVPQLRDSTPQLPAGYQVIVDRAMAKEPDERYQRGADLAAAFRSPPAVSSTQRTVMEGALGKTVLDSIPPTVEEPYSGAAETIPDPAADPDAGLPWKIIAPVALLLIALLGFFIVRQFMGGGPDEPQPDPVSEVTNLAMAMTSEAEEALKTSIAGTVVAETEGTIEAEAAQTAAAAPAIEEEPTTEEEPAIEEELPVEEEPPVPPVESPLLATPMIVFQSNRDGDYEIYSVNPEGGDLRQLTNNNQDDMLPRLSPKGNLIAFQSNRDGKMDIYIMDPDGSNQSRLTASAGTNRLPSWSADGEQIVFASNRLDPSDSTVFDIFIMDWHGGNARQVTDDLMHESHPSLSRDGRLAINVTFPGTPNYQIVSLNLDGSDRRRLTNSSVDEWSPEWSPDGRRILFLSERDDSGNSAIYTMDANGGDVRFLYNSEQEEWGAIWSPDGSQIVFAMDQPDGTADLYTMNADGSGARLLLERGGYPSWALVGGNEEIASPSPTIAPPPTSAPPTAVVVHCPGAAQTRLSLGAKARIVIFQVNVRQGPGSNYPVDNRLRRDRTVEIVGGPECDDGELWYQVVGDAFVNDDGETVIARGWIAEESDNDWLMEPE